MEMIIVFLATIGLGAIIGGVTNFIAITMLFRPYRAYYIGSWKIPFTPGLIPKRHQEIAVQLGELVEKHLLPQKKLGENITGPELQKKVDSWIHEKIDLLLKTEYSLNELFHNLNNGEIWVGIKEKKLWEPVLSSLTELVVDRLEAFLYSEEGEDFLYQGVQQGLAGQGMLAHMLGAILSKERLIDKLRPICVSVLRKPSTSKQIEAQLQAYLEEVFHRDIASLLNPYEKELRQFGERLTPWFISWLKSQLPGWLASFQFSSLVREQVLSFPLEQLEAIIKEVARRELKMITWLGALLGGVIGFFQAILYHVINH